MRQEFIEPDLLLGTWFGNFANQLRFCGNMTFHWVLTTHLFRKRKGIRMHMHGRYSVSESHLVMEELAVKEINLRTNKRTRVYADSTRISRSLILELTEDNLVFLSTYYRGDDQQGHDLPSAFTRERPAR